MGQEILSAKQIRFLVVAKDSRDLCNAFYLTGGTALAGFYLGHRESEDLDFFSETEVDPLLVEIFLKSNQKKIGFQKFEFQKSFNRNLFFLYFLDGMILKTKFTYFPFPIIERGIRFGSLRIDNLRDIATNKVFTITQQLRSRDFIDLFFIIQKKKWGLRSLLKDARAKFDVYIDPIQLGSQLMKVRTLEDMPRMRVPLNEEKIKTFFGKEAANLKKKILHP